MKSKVCIVVPNYIETKDSEISLTCCHLTKEFIKYGFNITLLFPREINKNLVVNNENFAPFCNHKRVEFKWLSDTKEQLLVSGCNEFKQSYEIFQYLLKYQDKFANIHFMDAGGLGFHTIQAKNTMRCFSKTVFTVTVISPRAWKNECMNQWEPDSVNGLKIDYMERYSIEHSDKLFCSSKHILKWLKKNEWKMPKDVKIIPIIALDWDNIIYKYNQKKIVITQRLTKIQTPLVSIIMPFYNDYKYIEESITSLLENDYSNFEIIICDDGSNIPLKYPEVKVLRKLNGGPASARNYAVKYAKGEYLIFCDSDNVFNKNLISSLVHGIQISKVDCLTVASNCSNYTIKSFLGAAYECGLLENIFGDTTSIIKRNVFETLGGFDESMKEYEDWAFFSKLIINGYKLDSIPMPLYWYRIREDGVNSKANKYRGHKAIEKLYKAHRAILPFYYTNENANAHNAAVEELMRAHKKAKEIIKNAKKMPAELEEEISLKFWNRIKRKIKKYLTGKG